MTDKMTRVDAGPMEGLFCMVLDTLRREEENVFVHGQAVLEFRGVGEDGGRNVPVILQEFCGQMGWRLQTIRDASSSTVWVTVSMPDVSMKARSVMNGTLERSFVVFQPNARGIWKEVEVGGGDASTDRVERRQAFDVGCGR